MTLRGEHDLRGADALRAALRTASDARKAVVVELSIVSFIDSTILGAIMGGLRRARDEGLGFALVVPPAQASGVRRVLTLTGLLAVFPAYETTDEALQAASQGVNTPEAFRERP